MARNVSRLTFSSIAIHHHDPLASRGGQSGRNGQMLAEIAAEPQPTELTSVCQAPPIKTCRKLVTSVLENTFECPVSGCILSACERLPGNRSAGRCKYDRNLKILKKAAGKRGSPKPMSERLFRRGSAAHACSGLTRGRTRRGPASARRPSRLGKSKSARRRAACIARLTCRQAVRRAAVATWALAARVNLWTVRRAYPLSTGERPRPSSAFARR